MGVEHGEPTPGPPQEHPADVAHRKAALRASAPASGKGAPGKGAPARDAPGRDTGRGGPTGKGATGKDATDGETESAALTIGRGSAIIVGAGVSGCACGAVLAAAGTNVTLVNCALDGVNLPSLGPVLCEGPNSVSEALNAFSGLPSALSNAWIDACLIPESGTECVVIDRRRLSIETKRALESIPGLGFRQGLIVDMTVPPAQTVDLDAQVLDTEREPHRVRVSTAFGEQLEADVVVLAPGLSLGGRIKIGDVESVGGRYGETPSEALYEALSRMGIKWHHVLANVGRRRLRPRTPEQWAAAGRCAGEQTAEAFSGLREMVGLHEVAADRTSAAPRAGVASRNEDASRNETTPRGVAAPDGDAVSHEITGTGDEPSGDGKGTHQTQRHAEATVCAQSLRTLVKLLAAEGGRRADAEAGGGGLERAECCDSSPADDRASTPGPGTWGDQLPPSPYWDTPLHYPTFAAVDATNRSAEVSSGDSGWWLYPDGLAVGEVCEAWSAQDSGECGDAPASRPAEQILGMRIAGVDQVGRVDMENHADSRVWVTGRAGGATTYLESLRSGIEVAQSILRLRRHETLDVGSGAMAASGNEVQNGRHE